MNTPIESVFTGETVNVETQANFEGNASEVLFSRLHTKKIKEQIIELLYQGDQSRAGTFIETLVLNEKHELVFDDAGQPKVNDRTPYVPRTKEEIEKQYDETLAEIESVTEIGFSEHSHEIANVDKIYIGALVPWSGKPFTARQISITEAHEKGHRMREYAGSFFDTYFHRGFDFTKITFSKEELESFRKASGPESNKEPDEKLKEIYIDYLSSPVELVERMSQLKNYFGMRADENFTKEHLDYARVHYVPDTDMDNGMTQFFQAITPEKEEEFIKLMNTAGI